MPLVQEHVVEAPDCQLGMDRFLQALKDPALGGEGLGVVVEGGHGLEVCVVRTQPVELVGNPELENPLARSGRLPS